MGTGILGLLKINQPTDSWRQFLPLWAALGMWVALIGLFTLQTVVVDSVSWAEGLWHTTSFWLLWALFLPIVVWVTFRFPLERAKLPLHILVHLVCCAAVIALSQVAYRTVLTLPPPPRAYLHHENNAGADGNHSKEDDHGDHLPVGMRSGPDTMVYLMTVSVCVAFAHSRRSQARERRAIELEARLAQAQLQTLRMQINPHFLFNTLNAIATLVHTNPETADDMITDLSELFRNSLDSLNEYEVTLARELELLRHYLRIEQRRFGDRLRIEEQIAPDTLSAYVPTLLLQPLVENAIRHGIERQRGPGAISIQIRREGDQLHVNIHNTGTEQTAAATNPRRRGIGLANTRSRLQQLYGDRHKFQAGAEAAGGWTVAIVMPWQAQPVTPVTGDIA